MNEWMVSSLDRVLLCNQKLTASGHHLEEPVPSWDFVLRSSAPSEITELEMAVPFQFRKPSKEG